MTDVTLPKISGEALPKTRRRHAALEDFLTTFRYFLKNKVAVAGFAITLVYFVLTIMDYVYPQFLGVRDISTISSWIPIQAPSYRPTPPFVFPSTAPSSNPSWWFWLGTTQYRIPLLPVIIAALKTDITISLTIVLIGMAIGIVVGAVSGYLGGVVDETVMRVTDVFFSVPALILAIAFVYVLSQTTHNNLFNLELALILVWWPVYARLTRGVTLTVKSMKFIEASIASGASKFRVIFSHVLPNVLSPSFVQLSLDLGSVVLILAALSFIQLPILNPNLPELGALISGGQDWLVGGFWWAVAVPGVFLLIFTVAVNLMGDGLRDVLDPKMRGY